MPVRKFLGIVALFLALAVLPLSAYSATVYVSNQGIDKIQVVDTNAKQVVKEIVVEKTPHNLLFSSDKKWLFVASVGSGDLTILDVEKGEIAAKVPADKRAHGLALSPNGKELYVINVGADNVSVVDLVEKKVVATIAVGKAPAPTT